MTSDLPTRPCALSECAADTLRPKPLEKATLPVACPRALRGPPELRATRCESCARSASHITAEDTSTTDLGIADMARGKGFGGVCGGAEAHTMVRRQLDF